MVRTGQKTGRKSIKSSEGFTLLEALLASMLLGIVAYSVFALYSTGFMAIQEQSDMMLMDSRLRGKMEELLSLDLNLAADGSESVSINGKNYNIVWTFASVDLDNDSSPEPDARLVTVSCQEVPGRALTAIAVDNDGRLGKI